jgi:hypothetical protein
MALTVDPFGIFLRAGGLISTGVDMVLSRQGIEGSLLPIRLLINFIN